MFDDNANWRIHIVSFVKWVRQVGAWQCEFELPSCQILDRVESWICYNSIIMVDFQFFSWLTYDKSFLFISGIDIHVWRKKNKKKRYSCIKTLQYKMSRVWFLLVCVDIFLKKVVLDFELSWWLTSDWF